jgi:hypothetical protein
MADAIRNVYSASRAPSRKMRDSDREYPL